MTTQPADPQPEGSIRSVPFDLVPAGDGLTLEGYAAVFNEPTRIKNRFEDFTETIAPGAFARAIRANPRPIMQFEHGLDPQVGHAPIAAIQSMREDARGLFVSARMHENWSTKPIMDAIKSGAISGMSFRFNAEGDQVEWSDDLDSRTVIDLDLHELGPVVFPAYAASTVTLRSRQLAAAVADDPVLLEDFSIGLLLAGHRDEQPDTPDDETDPTLDDETDARTDDEDVESFVVESPAPAESEGVRVANPAKHAQALMAVRTDLATQRSRRATHELSDR
jgi:HK97 family phage prohead protease